MSLFNIFTSRELKQMCTDLHFCRYLQPFNKALIIQVFPLSECDRILLGALGSFSNKVLGREGGRRVKSKTSQG